jgi:hypothetical protein
VQREDGVQFYTSTTTENKSLTLKNLYLMYSIKRKTGKYTRIRPF